MSDTPVHITTMYRWGDEESHSYVLGAFDDPQTAIEEGEKERINRGGGIKYCPEVIQVYMGEVKNGRVILSRDNQWQRSRRDKGCFG